MQKICNLLNEIDISLIWSKGHQADVRVRPMTRQRNNLSGGLWYFCQRTPFLTALYGTSPQVTVAVSCPPLRQSAALTGDASIVDHKASLANFNVKTNKVLLPTGVDPEQLVLLKIDVQKMDFWEWQDDTLIHLSGAIPALTVTDQLPAIDRPQSLFGR